MCALNGVTLKATARTGVRERFWWVGEEEGGVILAPPTSPAVYCMTWLRTSHPSPMSLPTPPCLAATPQTNHRRPKPYGNLGHVGLLAAHPRVFCPRPPSSPRSPHSGAPQTTPAAAHTQWQACSVDALAMPPCPRPPSTPAHLK
eukprot:365154-Chlamydomonas_euryale.AAC.5